MKQKPITSESGVQIDNLLTMALQHKSWKRNRAQLILLALLGSVSGVMTLLSMFSPPCNTLIIVCATVLIVIFFCWHAEHTKGLHFTLLLFLTAYVYVFVGQKERISLGMLHLMNAIYQTLSMNDWTYFEAESELSPEGCTTLFIVLLIIPFLWLLSYAVMRYQNFFLSLLATFPFVEIGFFFGIAPDHLPAIGLFAFWCSMGAVQLAGTSCLHKSNKAGFLRRRNTFFPVSDMRFLLTECSGVLTAFAVLALALLCDAILAAAQYERPEKIKQMRSDFQHYTASIDWSDLSSILPNTSSGSTITTAKDEIELGENESREFEDTTISRVTFSDIPKGRVYLKFSTYHEYNRNTWSRLPENIYEGAVFDSFDDIGLYPPEFLYYTAVESPISPTISMSLQNPNELLSQCVPYGFQKNNKITCRADDVRSSGTLEYTIFGGIDYEFLLQHSEYRRMTVRELLASSSSNALTSLAQDSKDKTIYVPSHMISPYGSNAAILTACGYGDFVREHYLSVPNSAAMRSIQALYADLLDGFDAETADPSETILMLQLLRERLCSQVNYSLSPGKTPPSRDFVAYFVLENKKGYCTHYASAAVLISRMAGIPARYCEGYMIDTFYSEETARTGQTVYCADILDSNAHAWCEVFLDGIGWIPFEFTYTYFKPPELTAEESTEMTELVTEMIPETYPQESYVSPRTETPNTDTAPTGAVIPPATELETPAVKHAGLIAAILCGVGFLTAVIGGVIAARSIALRRRMRCLRDKQLAAGTAWKWLLALLEEYGVDTSAKTTAALMEAAQSACAAQLSPETLEDAITAGSKLRYSPHGLSDEELKLLIVSAQTLTKQLYQASNPMQKFRLKWVKHYL